MALNKFEWKNGTKVEPARVNIGGESYEVTDAQYEGETPLSAANLNLMQDTILENVKDNVSDNTKIPSNKAVKDAFSTKTATAYLSNNITNVGQVNLPLNTIKSNTDKLTLVTNGIRIGEGVSQVLISGNVLVKVLVRAVTLIYGQVLTKMIVVKLIVWRFLLVHNLKGILEYVFLQNL